MNHNLRQLLLKSALLLFIWLAALPAAFAQTLDSEEAAFLTLINNFRAQNGAGPLQISAALENSATWMSNDMATKNYVSHTDSLGRQPGTRFAAFGYPYSPWGENIAAGYNSAQDVFNGWATACDPDSSGHCTYAHRANMLYAGYKVMGIARTYYGASTYGWYWVNDFGGVVDQPGAGTLQFSAATYTVNEYAGSATITVTRAGGSSGAVGLSYATSNGTATGGNDYTATSGNLYWSDGDTANKTFSVPIVNDSTSESNETINLVLSNPTGGATLGSPSTAVLTIVDDDPARLPGTLQFSAAAYTVNESGGSATITVTRAGGSSGAVGVSYATSNGTATAGNDYTATGGNLSWSDGDTASKTFTVPIINDSASEGNETINLILSASTGGAVLGSPSTAVLTIIDQSPPPPPPSSASFIFWRNVSTGENTVWSMSGATRTNTAALDPLSGPWRMVATVDFNGDGKADILWRNFATGANMVWYMSGETHTGSADLPPDADPNWRIVGSADFNGDGKPDLVWRNISTGENRIWYMNGITKTGSAALTTVTDQNWRIAGAADFNGDQKVDILWRNSVTGQNVVWYLDGITRTGIALPESLADTTWTFAGITDLNNDKKPDILWRNTASGANMVWYLTDANHTGTAPLDPVIDPNMEMPGQGNYSPGSPAPASPGSLQFGAASYTVNEYAGSATITVTRTGGSSGTVGVSYATSNGTATAGSDYTATSGSLSWSDGDTSSKTFTVPIINDSANEGDETINLILSNPAGGAILGSPSAVVLTIAGQSPPPSSCTSRIFWRNISTGENSVWCMNGAEHSGTAPLDPLSGPWRMAALADFNGDGQADILWRNFATGANMVWYMNGGSHTGSADLPPETDRSWRIAGVADFNGDGKADILWRNISTGENRVWYMNGITKMASAALATIADQSWRIAGAADFNADEKADILWRNSVTGQNAFWYLDGITRTGVALPEPLADSTWVLVGTIELNNDGHPEMLWRNTASGANMVWYMNGATHTGTAALDTVTDPNMEMAGQGNYY